MEKFKWLVFNYIPDCNNLSHPILHAHASHVCAKGASLVDLAKAIEALSEDKEDAAAGSEGDLVDHTYQYTYKTYTQSSLRRQ